MYTLNKSQIIGRVTRDPEMKQTKGGTNVVSASLGTNYSKKQADGSYADVPEFTNITLFGKTAEIYNQYVKKGDLVFVEGRLQTDSWEKEGVKQYKTSIIVNQMILLGNKGEKKEVNHVIPTEDASISQPPF